MTALMTDLTFDCMGTTVRLLTDQADECRAFLEHFDATLSRFRPGSELCRLNADPRAEVEISSLLHAAIAAGLLAAELTDGLVDPTLVGPLEANGYDRTRRSPELALEDALAQAPPRAPAQADPKQPWRRITLTDDAVRRPPGLRFDTGGTGKGLAADLLASRLDGRFAIDCGGDIRVGGAFDVEVRHPLTASELPHAARRGRRGRHLGHRHPHLGTRRTPVPSPARSVHRRVPPGPA